MVAAKAPAVELDDGPTREVLGRSPVFAPQIARLFGDPALMTVGDVLRCLP